MEKLKLFDNSNNPKLKNIDCLATPLVEVLSVNIYANDDENNNSISKIYGTIKVIDGQGALFDLYNREENDEETVSANGGSITLTRPNRRAISPFYQVEVEVDIKDKARNSAAVAKGFLSWDYRTKDDYDQVQTEIVYGSCGYYAAIRYITFRYAVMAIVEVGFVKDRYTQEFTPLDVYGNIVARCYNEITNTSTTGSTILFENTLNNSLRVVCGHPVNQSRRVVVVPAYSSGLEITANFWNSDTKERIYSKQIKCPTWDRYHRCLEYYEKGENCRIKVLVWWNVLHMQPPPERILKHRIDEEASNEESTNGNNKEKRLKLISDHAPFSASSSDSWMMNPHSDMKRSAIRPRQGLIVVEVFSVVINNNNNDGSFNLLGTITVIHWNGESFIFNRDKISAERLLGNQTAATITGPDQSCFGHIHLLLDFDLKDSEGHEISWGFLEWCDLRLERLPLLDKQLCSIITGDSGYAAVHYTLISAAAQAKVNICVVTENRSTSLTTNRCQVHGSVYTEYGNYKYVTNYEKQHYRSKLFLKHPENSELLSSSSHEFEVPLLKSIVAVPLNSALIVDVDLLVTYNQHPGNIEAANGGEAFQGRLKFNTHNLYKGSKFCQKIRRDHQNYILVNVEWSELEHLKSVKRMSL